MSQKRSSATTAPRRHNASGESTRIMLMEVAERLFAERGIDAVTLREIQVAAGQANTSVIRYHFGSRDGLIGALIAYRQAGLAEERRILLKIMREEGKEADPRAVVWLMARPLADSIRAGELYVAFLARLLEDPAVSIRCWPEDVADEWTQERIEELIAGALQDLPELVRRGRTFQLYVGLLNVLAERARSGRGISEAQLHNYVDGWVGMLTAPISYETRGLLAERQH